MTTVDIHAPACGDPADGGACWDECACTNTPTDTYTAGCPLHDLATALEATKRIVAALDSIPPPPGTPTPPLLTAVPGGMMPDDVRAVLDQAATVTPLPHSCEDDSHAAGCRCHQGGPVTYDDAAWFCDTAKALVVGERNADYGDALDNFARTGKLWEVVLGVPVSPEQFALCMILVKLERLTNTIDHTDSWTDIIGYAALGGDVASRPGRNSRAT